MILEDESIRELLPEIIKIPDYSMINPASLDIRIGHTVCMEAPNGEFISMAIQDDGIFVLPQHFILVSTFEHITVPNGYVAELRLKSSSARAGWDHSLAFWVDPGWSGILTMEIRNNLWYKPLLLTPGKRFAQLIFHKLVRPAKTPYNGKYNSAIRAEIEKV